MSRQTTRRAGRPAAQWLAPSALAALAVGTPVALETTGRHDRRTVGRIAAATESHLLLASATGDPLLAWDRVKRGRVVEGLYEPGDPVLRRQIPAADWRGGVVRTEGTDVLVEQIDGSFDWFPESALEPADARDPVAPAHPRGPVPARAG